MELVNQEAKLEFTIEEEKNVSQFVDLSLGTSSLCVLVVGIDLKEEKNTHLEELKVFRDKWSGLGKQLLRLSMEGLNDISFKNAMDQMGLFVSEVQSLHDALRFDPRKI